MPAETFYRLPQEKQERIVNAAIDEFAAYSFGNASINRIVKAAGIPRGSFYQYFSGKEDIYLLVMNRISEEKLKILSRVRGEKECGFFETILKAVPAIFEWAEAYPRYQQIGFRAAADDSEFVKSIVAKMDRSRDYLREALLADQKKGYIREDVDLNLVMNIYFSQSLELFKLYGEPDGEEKIEKGVLALTDLLMNGIGIGTGKKEEA